MEEANDKSNTVEDILRDLGKVTEEQLEEARRNSKKKNVTVQEELRRLGWISSDDINHALAMQYGMEISLEVPKNHLDQESIKKVPYAFAKRNCIIPFEKRGKSYAVAIADPLNLNAIDEIRFFLGGSIIPVFTSRKNIITAIDGQYDKDSGSASKLISDISQKGDASQDEKSNTYDLLSEEEQAPIIKLLNLIITEAIQQGASDIHFEPFENDLKVRYRIDGVLHNRHSPPQEYQSQLLTRLKVISQLDIAERRLPQDGRVKLNMGGREIDFRISTVPVINGERIVMRILDKSNIVMGIEKMMMLKEVEKKFRKLITLPEGIVLVTGPTGSGKTTTLYSAIREITSDNINIMTIEDPVEYKFSGIAQIGVHPKIDLDFATGLRHILRQDPDVIMVGEIRDAETAEIAIQASLTGHLVLSTLHTNDAPSAITRLVDMGIEPYLLSSSVVAVLAQRLVRKICPHCIESYIPSSEELKEIGIERKQLKEKTLSRGKGCSQCFNSGYKGRHGIYELMPVSNSIKRQLTKNADAARLRQCALEEGMLSLRNNGSALVREGITTVEEVLRVTRSVELGE